MNEIDARSEGKEKPCSKSLQSLYFLFVLFLFFFNPVSGLTLTGPDFPKMNATFISNPLVLSHFVTPSINT